MENGTLDTATLTSFLPIGDLTLSLASILIRLTTTPGKGITFFNLLMSANKNRKLNLKDSTHHKNADAYDLHENSTPSYEGEGEFSTDLYTR